MKKTIICAIAMMLSLAAKADYTPSEAVMQSRTQFQDDKFGIFIHWGIYSVLGKGEWVMYNDKLNYLEYPKVAEMFNPVNFDADAWVKAFADAGAKYITFTSRHHDGFSMWDTKASDYNIMEKTPYGKDVIAQLAEACKKYGIHLQLYYSHMDWQRNDYPMGKHGNPAGHPTDQQDYAHYLKFMEDQLTELLTKYGPIRSIWFDGYWDHNTPETQMDWKLDEQYALIHSLQPACMVGNNHHTTPFEGEDYQLFERDMPGDNTAGMSAGQGVSTRLPLETCQTMNGSWGYNSSDHAYKSVDALIQLLVRTAGKNANLLLNIGPKPDGTLPQESLDRLKGIGEWMKANGETIYGTRGSIIDSTNIQKDGQNPNPNWVSTRKGNKLYVHIFKNSGTSLTLPLAPTRVASACMFAGKASVTVAPASAAGKVTLTLPAAPSGVDTIVELTLTE